MENLLQSIVALQRRLNDAGIASIVIGGVAVAAWGDPRVTRDVDLKILAERDDAERLLAMLAPDYTSLLLDPRQALTKQGILFVQDTLETRLDLSLADTPYDVVAIQRGRDIELQPGLINSTNAAQSLFNNSSGDNKRPNDGLQPRRAASASSQGWAGNSLSR